MDYCEHYSGWGYRRTSLSVRSVKKIFYQSPHTSMYDKRQQWSLRVIGIFNYFPHILCERLLFCGWINFENKKRGETQCGKILTYKYRNISIYPSYDMSSNIFVNAGDLFRFFLFRRYYWLFRETTKWLKSIFHKKKYNNSFDDVNLSLVYFSVNIVAVRVLGEG